MSDTIYISLTQPSQPVTVNVSERGQKGDAGPTGADGADGSDATATAKTWTGDNPNIPETLTVVAVSGNENIDGLEITRRADEGGYPAWGDVTYTYIRQTGDNWAAYVSNSGADEFSGDETSSALTPVGILFDNPTTGSGSIQFTGDNPSGDYLGQRLQDVNGGWWTWNGSSWEPTVTSATTSDGTATLDLGDTLNIYGSGAPGDTDTAFAKFTHSAGGDLTISTEKTGTGTAGDVVFGQTINFPATTPMDMVYWGGTDRGIGVTGADWVVYWADKHLFAKLNRGGPAKMAIDASNGAGVAIGTNYNANTANDNGLAVQGSVAVGKALAGEKLDVDGNIKASGTVTGGDTLNLYGSGAPGDYDTAFAKFTHSTGGNLTISTEQTNGGTAGEIVLGVGAGNEHLKINTSGNLYITLGRSFYFGVGRIREASSRLELLPASGGVYVGGIFEASGTVQAGTYAYANLPAATTRGLRAFCSDSNTAASGNFASAFAGGGVNFVPCYSDGTDWRIG